MTVVNQDNEVLDLHEVSTSELVEELIKRVKAVDELKDQSISSIEVFVQFDEVQVHLLDEQIYTYQVQDI